MWGGGGEGGKMESNVKENSVLEGGGVKTESTLLWRMEFTKMKFYLCMTESILPKFRFTGGKMEFVSGVKWNSVLGGGKMASTVKQNSVGGGGGGKNRIHFFALENGVYKDGISFYVLQLSPCKTEFG